MKKDSPRLLVADKKGRIFEDPSLEATGMKADYFFRLDTKGLIKLPAGSRLFAMPDRRPVGFNAQTGIFAEIRALRAVAAFVSPGYTLTHSASFREYGKPSPLPLFSYGACAFWKGEIYAAAIRVDKDLRHDSTLIDLALVRKNIKKFGKLFPKNRLIAHLAECALIHGCPNAQNFFLSRYEAPLPVSPSCNAACAGCISYQAGKISCSQPRIKFVPTAGEIAEIALYHIGETKDPIISFGQGCEGEPLLQAQVIEEAIGRIRKADARGTINLNTNGSSPEALSRLFDAGLDTVRISMNSAREEYYSRYYRPRGYSFKDVVRSIAIAKSKNAFISLNYLTMPGFTDSPGEVRALEGLIARYNIDMIQWRNLNYDPILYFKTMRMRDPEASGSMGISGEMGYLKKRFPGVMAGYFNPSRRTILRAAASRRR